MCCIQLWQVEEPWGGICSLDVVAAAAAAPRPPETCVVGGVVVGAGRAGGVLELAVVVDEAHQ